VIALALIFAAGFEVPSEHRIEILTPSRVLTATDCHPEYLVNNTGGTTVGGCARVESQALPPRTVGSGDHIVQLAQFQGLTFYGCALTSVRRTIHPEPQTLMSFECQEPQQSAPAR
jgi:hypothetical protein